MADLTTSYMGMQLRNPLIASASPLTGELDELLLLDECGVGAVVLPSIFEEDLREEQDVLEKLYMFGAQSVAEVAEGYFPPSSSETRARDRHLELIDRARRTLGMPVIASLNGFSDAGWVEYARLMTQAGANAIELNIYDLVVDPTISGHDVERRHADVVERIRRSVAVPVAVKVTPFYSAFGNMAMSLVAAGADALVLFNRLYYADIDLLKLRPSYHPKLSHSSEIGLPLLWIANLYGRVPCSLAATTGVETIDEVLKYLIAGADVVMTTSALLRHGVTYVRSLLDGLRAWLDARDFGSVGEVRGMMSRRARSDDVAVERAAYRKVLHSFRPVVSDTQMKP
jgi:dihydroorotate dehydrogenase (fumarate)